LAKWPAQLAASTFSQLGQYANSPGHRACYAELAIFFPSNHRYSLVVISMDHSFLRNTEFWAKPRNLPICAEFLCFHGIFRNSVLFRQGDKYGIFRWSSGNCTVCTHDFTMKYMTATRALTGGIPKILSWAYLKYWRLIW